MQPLRNIYASHNVPIFGVIYAGSQRAVALAKGEPIGVIGTQGTIEGQQYQREIHHIDPHTEVHTQPCPLFVSLIEENWLNGPIVEQIIKHYLDEITQNVLYYIGMHTLSTAVTTSSTDLSKTPLY